MGFMAAGALLVSLSNIGFNYLLIAVLGLGVAGSALGTVAAQVLAVIVAYRPRAGTVLRAGAILRPRAGAMWGQILALGAPQSLGLAGMVLTSGATIAALNIWAAGSLSTSLPAYGIMLRIMSFVAMPLFGPLAGHAIGDRQQSRRRARGPGAHRATPEHGGRPCLRRAGRAWPCP